MPSYEVCLNLDLLSAVPTGGEQRRKTMAFIHSLREHPGTPGDFTHKDASSRELQVKLLANMPSHFGWTIQRGPS